MHSSLIPRFCAGFFDNPDLRTLDSVSAVIAEMPWAAFDVELLKSNKGKVTLNLHSLGQSLNFNYSGDVLA